MVNPLNVLGLLKGLSQALVDLLLALRREKSLRSREAAAYFLDLSAAMTKVVEELRGSRIPRIDGNKMNTLIHGFPEKTKNVRLPDVSLPVKSALDEAAAVAERLDAYLLGDAAKNEDEREEMLAFLERIAGTCSGIADLLKKPA